MKSSNKDNKWIEFVAAVICGLVVSLYSQYSISFIKPMWSTLTDFKYTLIYIVAFAFAAFAILSLRSRMQVKISWVFISILGAIICALFDEVLSQNNSEGVFRETIMLPIGVAIYALITLPIMFLTIPFTKSRTGTMES